MQELRFEPTELDYRIRREAQHCMASGNDTCVRDLSGCLEITETVTNILKIRNVQVCWVQQGTKPYCCIGSVLQPYYIHSCLLAAFPFPPVLSGLSIVTWHTMNAPSKPSHSLFSLPGMLREPHDSLLYLFQLLPHQRSLVWPCSVTQHDIIYPFNPSNSLSPFPALFLSTANGDKYQTCYTILHLCSCCLYYLPAIGMWVPWEKELCLLVHCYIINT